MKPRAFVLLSLLISGGCATPERPDVDTVVLISIDTCRADRLGSYGYSRAATPRIDAVADEGVRFEHAVSPVPITLPAHASLLTGTIPPHHAVRDNGAYRLDDAFQTLAETLGDHGFRTAAFVGAFVLDHSFGLEQGFELYEDRIADNSVHAELERRGEDVSRLAVDWLEKNRNGRAFLFLHYFDPHADYRPPEPFATRFADDPYVGEVAYADWCIGKVLDKLVELGRYDSSLIAITADHGEALGEHQEPTHAYYIYQSTLHVPMIFKMPGSRETRVVSDYVSIIDVMPTIIDWLGLPVPAGVQGRSLVPFLTPADTSPGTKDIYVESLTATKYGCSPLLGIVREGWKYIRTTKPELYNLDEDPDERVNLIEAQPDRARELDDRLARILTEHTNDAELGKRATIDPLTQDRLEALGYLTEGRVDDALVPEERREDPKDFMEDYLRLKRASRHYDEGRLAEAKTIGRELVARRPDLSQAHSLLGNIYFDEGKWLEASRSFSEMLRIDPDSFDGHLDLGVVLARQGKLEEALGHFTEAARIDPDSLVALDNLGNALASLGRLSEATETYRRALAIDSEDAGIHLNLCVALGRQGQFDQALENCRQALRLRPGWTDALKVVQQIEEAGGEIGDSHHFLIGCCYFLTEFSRRRNAGSPKRW